MSHRPEQSVASAPTPFQIQPLLMFNSSSGSLSTAFRKAFIRFPCTHVVLEIQVPDKGVVGAKVMNLVPGCLLSTHLPRLPVFGLSMVCRPGHSRNFALHWRRPTFRELPLPVGAGARFNFRFLRHPTLKAGRQSVQPLCDNAFLTSLPELAHGKSTPVCPPTRCQR